MSTSAVPLTPDEAAALVAQVRARLNAWVPGEEDQGVVDMAAMVLRCGLPERERDGLLREIELHFLASFDGAEGSGARAVRPLLIEWLDTATRGLCADAKSRIRAEVSDHFDAAIAAGVANGDTRLDAALRARAELGCPNAARERFLNSNLTAWEERQIAQIEGRAPMPSPGRRKLWIALTVIGVLCVPVWVYLLIVKASTFGAFFLACFAQDAVAMIGQPLHRHFRLPLRTNLGIGIALQATLIAAALSLSGTKLLPRVAYFSDPLGQHEDLDGLAIGIAVYLVLTVINLLRHVRMLQKLPKAQWGVRS